MQQCAMPHAAEGIYTIYWTEAADDVLRWAARYNTWHLIKLTPKGVVFSFLFFSDVLRHMHSVDKS